MRSFTPGDRITVTDAVYQGHAGAVVGSAGFGQILVQLDDRDDVLTFWPDELALDLLAEGAQTISGLRSAIEAVAA